MLGKINTNVGAIINRPRIQMELSEYEHVV